ncbi:MAG: hypothetical protein K0Q92_644 [Steroidobacteraceae bacterium]|jgi:hypothetical protein|nr:hypothetical protein [Steroidobacteraceae bacterium]
MIPDEWRLTGPSGVRVFGQDLEDLDHDELLAVTVWLAGEITRLRDTALNANLAAGLYDVACKPRYPQ